MVYLCWRNKIKQYYNLTELANGWLLVYPVLDVLGVLLRTDKVYYTFLDDAIRDIIGRQNSFSRHLVSGDSSSG